MLQIMFEPVRCLLAHVSRSRLRLTALAFSLAHVVLSIAPARADNSKENTAADLGDFPSVGWPLGAPLTCQALTDTLTRELFYATQKIRSYCNEQNEKMRKAGYLTCGRDECLESVVARDGGYNYGTFVLRIYRSVYTHEPVLTLSYTYPGTVVTGATFPVCFDPASRTQQVLNDEFASWDFRRFAELCVVPRSEK